MTQTRIAAISLLLGVSLSTVHAQSHNVDGVFSDWIAADVAATDPRGDTTGAFDILSVSASIEGEFVFVHFAIGQALNLQAGEELNGSLQLNLACNDKKLEIDFRKRVSVDESGKRLGWPELGFQCMPTHASDKFEMRIGLQSLELGADDQLMLQFSGSDSLAKPIEILGTSALAAPTVEPFDWSKPEFAFRIVNQNTLRNGLADHNRQEKFKRLFPDCQR